MKRIAALVALTFSLWISAGAQSLQVPATVKANTALSVPTSGRGDAILYLAGPASFSKRTVKLGAPIEVAPEELHSAGQWLMTVKSGQGAETATFQVLPADTGKISFIVRPSRVPVAVAGGISGVAYLLDNYQNLVIEPRKVSFRLSIEQGPSESHVVESQYGVAWIKLDSGPKQGAAQFVAAADDVSENRVVQEVASHGCNLHITARPASSKDTIMVATDPVRDCGGNPIPDGTIVTFTQTQNGLVTTVDAPIKQGVAQVELAAVPSVISAASGVIMGNELRWGRP